MVPFEKLAIILKKVPNKLVFSRPVAKSTPRTIQIIRMRESKYPYQAQQFVDNKVFHTPVWDLAPFVANQLPLYKELHIMGEEDYSILLSGAGIVSIKKLAKQSKTQSQSHNRAKNYLINEGDALPIFVKLGIFTADYKVVSQKQDKFRQINRYLELLSNELTEYKEGDSIRILDYGCGKSYLSFAVYYYLTKKKKLHVSLTGIDLKADVIAECNRLAKDYGYDGMDFVAGDIKDYVSPTPVDLVISLHACDIATDYVLFGAISNHVKHIFSAPCCQHEASKQLDKSFLHICTRHGILKERICAILTDSIRVALLEINDYAVDIVEFVDVTDSPKNLLIRAHKCSQTLSFKREREKELLALLQESGISPTLAVLLGFSPIR